MAEPGIFIMEQKVLRMIRDRAEAPPVVRPSPAEQPANGECLRDRERDRLRYDRLMPRRRSSTLWMIAALRIAMAAPRAAPAAASVSQCARR